MLASSVTQASENGVEELTRGPVHEAFAASVSYNPEPGILVRSAPPSLIEEIPPDQRPVGENISWIPGYWGWDDETTDFIWISGVWRNMPPGRQWTPGYWGESESHWQWTSGYWADSSSDEVSYLPKPPRSIESGPNIEAPSRNHIWISGTWVNHEERYAWKPGYWEAGQQNWGWSPAHYQWTPRGYVFIDGYWDHDVSRRGVMFAPVRFNHDYYNRPNYTYTPLVVIALNVFANHLFVRPRYGQYYFGDYYSPSYRDNGFQASFSYRYGRYGYDPIYAHDRWRNRDNRGWEQDRRDDFDYYRSNKNARPARTWVSLQSRPEGKREDRRDNYQFAQALPEYTKIENGKRFDRVSKEDISVISERNKQLRVITQERSQIENRPADKAKEGPDQSIQAKREKSTRSPIAGKPIAQLSGDEAPPTRRKQNPTEIIKRKVSENDTNRDAPATAEEAAGPSKKDRSNDQAKQPGKTPSENGAQPRQEKKPTSPSAEPSKKERSPAPKSEEKPKPKQREQAAPQPSTNPEPKPKRVAPENPPPEQQARPERAAPAKPQKERHAKPGRAAPEKPPQEQQAPKADQKGKDKEKATGTPKGN